MPYKVNRLRTKRDAISLKRSELGRLGNEVKRAAMRERVVAAEVVGRMETSGTFGAHVIELLDCDDPTRVWVRVDGVLRSPKTCAGVRRAMADWIFSRSRAGGAVHG